ncbi:hypothetical protein BKA62DRAFT_718337 [Auriculariales sp. MPI-PUGE-AT-0066]|nr:hypothetical protein BKA62DRAFT_718337 [Auriculariales sp. MPI-PUGE-AT-0066]
MRDEDFKLSNVAEQLARDDPGAFRAKYGDYFIAGATYAVKYAAFVVHTEEDKQRRNNFNLHMNVGVEHFGMEVARTLDKHNVQMKYQVSIQAQNLGRLKEEARPPLRNYKNPPTLAAAANFAEWYIDPSNVEGIEVVAHLHPYSRLAGVELPFAVPVPRKTLDELDELRDKLRELYDVANLIPTFDPMPTPVWDLMSKKRTLFRLVDDKRVFIAHDQDLRSNFNVLAQCHIEEFQEFRRICTFWQLVNESKTDEPADGLVGYRNERAGGSRLFGCMHGTDDVKVVEWEKRQVRLDGSTSEEILLADIKVPQGTHIVGWSVSTDNRDGIWKQHSPHIIFSTLPQIKFYRVKKRRWPLPWNSEHCTYTVHVYAVQNNKYFSALCDTPPEDME